MYNTLFIFESETLEQNCHSLLIIFFFTSFKVHKCSFQIFLSLNHFNFGHFHIIVLPSSLSKILRSWFHKFGSKKNLFAFKNERNSIRELWWFSWLCPSSNQLNPSSTLFPSLSFKIPRPILQKLKNLELEQFTVNFLKLFTLARFLLIKWSGLLRQKRILSQTLKFFKPPMKKIASPNYS